MNPITQAVTGALSRLDEGNIKQLYSTLKANIQKRNDAHLSEALENLEQDPESEQTIEDFDDEIIVSGVRKDKIILTRAKTLLSILYPPDRLDNVGSSGTVLTDDSRYGIYYDADEDYKLEIG